VRAGVVAALQTASQVQDMWLREYD